MIVRLSAGRCSLCAATLAAVFVAGGSKDKEQVERYGMVIGVKPEKLAHYKRLHAEPWPVVNRTLKEAHIRNYSIYLTQFDNGKWYLFGYFEYIGSNFEADMKTLAGNDEVERWWKETDPCQFGLENRKEGEWWKMMEITYQRRK